MDGEKWTPKVGERVLIPGTVAVEESLSGLVYVDITDRIGLMLPAAAPAEEADLDEFAEAFAERFGYDPREARTP